MNYRLYSFVANHYLSPLQCGLQTAHVVSELSQVEDRTPTEDDAYGTWAVQHKTIIICGAGNHQGVLDCHAELVRTATALGLPVALFREDEQSMNGMATACGVIVPECYWDAKFERGIDYGGEDRWVYSTDFRPDGSAATIRLFPLTHPEGQFINHIKSFRLA